MAESIDRALAGFDPLLRWAFLGRVPYDEALALQLRLRAGVASGEIPDSLLLLEHPPVITLGRSAKSCNILADDGELARRGIAKRCTDRGGDVTYHGPGQLVGYPIRRVGRAVKPHVRAMSEALIALLGEHGIDAWWSVTAPGVWTRAGKVAAVGVDARGGVTTHGFALNIDPRLTDYEVIVPCGLPKPVTSLAALGVSPLPSVEQAARRLAALLADVFGANAVEVPAAMARQGRLDR